MSDWKISSNMVEDIKIYSVYKIIDEKEVDHSGNREYAGFYYNREDALREIEKRNKKELLKKQPKKINL